jgi:hypothetical protein
LERLQLNVSIVVWSEHGLKWYGSCNCGHLHLYILSFFPPSSGLKVSSDWR